MALDCDGGYCSFTELDVDSLQARATAWRARQPWPDSAELRLGKASEELGELWRAHIGRSERRPDRGDVGQEAAQTVLCLMSFLGKFYPRVDLLAEVRAELDRIDG